MLKRKAFVLCALMSGAFVAVADDAPESIVKFDGADLASLMQSSAAVKKTTEIRTTTAVPMFKSADAKFSSGLFSSTAGHAEFESYAGDEFCYFVSGEATITSADGTVLKLKAGDAITIPKGWKGRWDTTGYTKYFVSYRSPD